MRKPGTIQENTHQSEEGSIESSKQLTANKLRRLFTQNISPPQKFDEDRKIEQ